MVINFLLFAISATDCGYVKVFIQSSLDFFNSVLFEEIASV
jgi:hypothetical protein